MPVFGGRDDFPVRRIKSIELGDSSNSCAVEICSHLGTHIDAPRHFFTAGQAITTYPAEFFAFSQPYVIHVSLQPSELVTKDIMRPWEIPADCDLLLFKSGWTALRQQPVYCNENPGISPEVATLLRENFPALRAIGIDWLSVSAYRQRELGRKAHKILLDSDSRTHPVLPIEDMDLSCNLDGLSRVTVAPFRVEEFDSAPCTVLGEWHD